MIRAWEHRLRHLVCRWPAHIPVGTWVKVERCRASTPTHVGMVGQVLWCEQGPIVGLDRCQAARCRVVTVEEVALWALAR